MNVIPVVEPGPMLEDAWRGLSLEERAHCLLSGFPDEFEVESPDKVVDPQ